MTRPSYRDLVFALNLPESFLQQHDEQASDRVATVVRRHWSGYPAPARASLEQALLPILTTIDHPARVSDEMRTKCELAVMSWLEAQ